MRDICPKGEGGWEDEEALIEVVNDTGGELFLFEGPLAFAEDGGRRGSGGGEGRRGGGREGDG